MFKNSTRLCRISAGALALAGLMVTGCATQVRMVTAENFYVMAATAQAQGNWDLARRAYARAVVNAEQSGLPLQTRAVLTYEYGRSLGVTCFYELAEQELNRAHRLDMEAGLPLTFTLVELGRLKLAMQEYQSSARYFGRALKELDAIHARVNAPAAYVDVLEDYAAALSRTSNADYAAEIKRKANQVRYENPNTKSITDRTPYGTSCSKG